MGSAIIASDNPTSAVIIRLVSQGSTDTVESGQTYLKLLTIVFYYNYSLLEKTSTN